MEVRYEELLAAPEKVLKSAFEFCGLMVDDELVPAIVEKHKFENLKRSRLTPFEGIRVPEGHYRQGKVGGWQHEFTGLQRYLFDKIAGDLLRELGYAQKGWWAEGSHQKALMPIAARAYRLYLRGAQAGTVLLGRTNAERSRGVTAAIR